MAATCGFSSGFSAGFEICVAAEEPARPTGGGGTGTGRRIRRRPISHPVSLEGRGFITVLGRGELSAERALEGVARIEVRGTGLLALAQSLTGTAQIVSVATGQLGRLVNLAGTATVPTASSAQLGRLVNLAGTATLSLTVTADLDSIPRGVVELEGEMLMVATVAFGSLHRAVACAGIGSHSFTASGELSAERSLWGLVDESVSAWGNLEADDEQASLMVLDLPSEIVL